MCKSEAVRAIEYAMGLDDAYDGMNFLREWFVGDTSEYPDYPPMPVPLNEVAINWQPMSTYHQPTATKAGMVLLLLRMSDELEMIVSASSRPDGDFYLCNAETFLDDRPEDHEGLWVSEYRIHPHNIVAWATHLYDAPLYLPRRPTRQETNSLRELDID